MDRNDFWTHIIAALATILATLSTLLAPWHGPQDIYKLLFVAGPLAIIAITGLNHWRVRK